MSTGAWFPFSENDYITPVFILALVVKTGILYFILEFILGKNSCWKENSLFFLNKTSLPQNHSLSTPYSVLCQLKFMNILPVVDMESSYVKHHFSNFLVFFFSFISSRRQRLFYSFLIQWWCSILRWKLIILTGIIIKSFAPLNKCSSVGWNKDLGMYY